MRLRYYPYRYAGAVLEHADFIEAKNDLIEILKNSPVPLLNPDSLGSRKGVKFRKRDARRGDPGDRYLFFPVDQKALNALLDQQFRDRGWELHTVIRKSD